MSFVSFKVTKPERVLIDAVVARALKETKIKDGLCLSMDITACHANGTPLNLEKLLEADAFTFAHDIIGIHKNINRDTGKLGNHFEPRCARPESPFKASCGGEWCTVEDRLHVAKNFSRFQCAAALQQPYLQKTVRTFIERRLRKLEKEVAQ